MYTLVSPIHGSKGLNHNLAVEYEIYLLDVKNICRRVRFSVQQDVFVKHNAPDNGQFQ